MTSKNTSPDSSPRRQKDAPQTQVDCHVFLEDGAHNVLYANGGQQVALSVWYRVSRDGEPLHDLKPDQVQIQLVDQETGAPLMGKEWQWSTEKVCTTFLERKEAETGSKPDDETGYVKQTVYVTHEINLEGEGSILVGARVYWRNPETPGAANIGAAKQAVRVHWQKMNIIGWDAFHATDPQVATHVGQLDDGIRSATNGVDTSGTENMWRSANIYIKFKDDQNNTITKWDVPNNSYNIYQTRRNGYYETAAYIWPYEGKSGAETQTGTINLWFPSGCYPSSNCGYQTRTTEFQPGNGLVITLVTYVRFDRNVYTDEAGYDDVLTIYDKNNTPIKLFLNQLIPNTWADIKQSPNTFAPNVCGDQYNRITARDNVYGRLKNLQFGYAYQDSNRDIPCDGGAGNEGWYAMILMSGQMSSALLWNGHNGWYLAYNKDHDSDWDYELQFWPGDAYSISFYPVWDIGGFCMGVYIYDDQASHFIKAAASSPHYTYASQGGDAEDRFVWKFEPKW